MTSITDSDVAEFVLGCADRDTGGRVAGALDDDPAVGRVVAQWRDRLQPLTGLLPGVAPPPAVWQAIAARTVGSVPVRRTVHRGDGVWLALEPGIRLKYLSVSPVTGERTALLEMQPGSTVAAHDHDQIEECTVLSGEIAIDSVALTTGDHHVAPADSRHDAITTTTGALLLLHWRSTAA